MSLRSPHGCVRCKSRRQKCDEARPGCTRCLQAGIKCEYAIILKWNGRVPRSAQQSRTCKEASKSETTASPRSSSREEEIVVRPQNAQYSSQSSLDLPYSIDPWSSISSTSKRLLNHFVEKASFNAPHAQIRDQICAHVVPMIFYLPSLFHATIALAGLHYATLLRGVPAGFTVEEDVASHLSKSIGLLRRDLHEQRDVTFLCDILHTIRTLCVCEIYSGKADPSWRVHVNGAKAIIETALSKASAVGGKDLSSRLPFRWYSSIEALTALTARGLRDERNENDSPSVIESKLLQPTSCSDNYYFNIYTGYSSDLDSVFKRIGSLAQERQRFEHEETWETDFWNSAFVEADFHQKASSLERTVLSMVSRDDKQGLKLPPNVDLSVEELRQFCACNRAYQYSALIHIYRQVERLESTTNEVQDCVQQIISAVSSMLPVMELSPWVLLTTPIYTAGCEAIGSDRDIVRRLLRQLYETLRIRNTLRAISILENLWSAPTTSCESKCSENRQANGSLDFIPY